MQNLFYVRHKSAKFAPPLEEISMKLEITAPFLRMLTNADVC